MDENIRSLPAEHSLREGKRIPLCSRVARKNLGLLLGIDRDELETWDIYKDLNFAPIGTAIDVHDMYRAGWRSPHMIGDYQYAKTYGELIWKPPENAEYADMYFSTPAGHRCVAFRRDKEWYILDPYYDNEDIVPSYFPFPFVTYCALLYSLKGALLEGVAFYAKSDSHMNVANSSAGL